MESGVESALGEGSQVRRPASLGIDRKNQDQLEQSGGEKA